MQSVGHRNHYGQALSYAGRWDEAARVFQRLASDYPDDTNWLGHLGVALAWGGRTDGARQVQAQLAAMTQPFLRGAHTWSRACIAAALGEPAIELLRTAVSEGFYRWQWEHNDPRLASLWDLPGYQALIAPKDL